MPRTHGHMLQMHICTTSTACGASPPCTAFRMSAVAGETGVFLLLQFIHVLRLADKKYSTISFIFYGPLAEWALSVQQASSACLHACARASVCRRFKTPSDWRNVAPFPFSHFVFPLRICQDHMTATWPHWWPMNHGACVSAKKLLNYSKKSKMTY